MNACDIEVHNRLLFTHPAKSFDGSWMVALEIVDPSDGQMIPGGTAFMFESRKECRQFIRYIMSPAGQKLKQRALSQIGALERREDKERRRQKLERNKKRREDRKSQKA